jgi:ketosteroid isomerase-like protein
MRYALLFSMTLLSLVPALAQNEPVPTPHLSDTVTRQQADTQAIQQIEDDWLKGERTTDIAVLERVLSDDYVNLTPRGLGPDKAEIIKHLQPSAGQAPPYSLETRDLRIYILGDTAVAAYVKTYTANENGNAFREDTTHIFTKVNGVWKLRISRASIRPSD